MASTWCESLIDDLSASGDSSPGSVIAVASMPWAESAGSTSSHAHAPSQKPGTRTIGAAIFPMLRVAGGRKRPSPPGEHRDRDDKENSDEAHDTRQREVL